MIPMDYPHRGLRVGCCVRFVILVLAVVPDFHHSMCLSLILIRTANFFSVVQDLVCFRWLVACFYFVPFTDFCKIGYSIDYMALLIYHHPSYSFQQTFVLFFSPSFPPFSPSHNDRLHEMKNNERIRGAPG